ncbi:Decarbamoylnovobiocin carbamoyltransferase [Symmachiella macrocystis]|uniref:Decarbamoylnovobiocin carbamoyltransferase n=2 Tax=Symmachiella macrocystis TaxID=2527985 RepID=A0A5C6BTS4_9PLAN|nr:Decarbamoylnovobiocin carbamoyltransferase [Symmachiella macrocystis]
MSAPRRKPAFDQIALKRHARHYSPTLHLLNYLLHLYELPSCRRSRGLAAILIPASTGIIEIRMTAILGLSAFYHDSAAALIIDGEIVAAAQEERFTRIKHDFAFPQNAVDYCLAEVGITPEQLNYVGFYDKPVTKFERLLETYLAFVPAGYRSFRQAMPLWLKQKLHLPRELSRGLGGGYAGRFVFTDHHESHAASAFFPSPFEEAAILTIDGVGEWSTTCFGVGRGNNIQLANEIRFPHSLGLLYSALTYYTGFRVNSGEYKVMGLAPYGQPVYKDRILEHVLDLKADGSFRMDMSYFNYCQGLTMTSEKFHKLFGGPPREAESEVTQREMDLAASVQAVTEEVMLRMAQHVHEATGLKNLVLAGGVALNCVANGRILREGPFENIWIQPAAGDAGGALGTALFIWHQLLEKPRTPSTPDQQHGSFLGPQFSEAEIQQTLSQHNAVYEVCDSDEQLCEEVAELISQQNVIGWFQGRMEFGPRALGGRSILGDARSQKMQSLMNLKIKFRESFRPFAPIVLREYVDRYFEMRPQEDSPYMLLVAPVHPDIRTPPSPEQEQAFGIDKLNFCRSEIPAVTHVDYSARVQTVDRDRNPLVHQLLTCYYQKTECPVLINTSFNVRSEPIVCTPEDAYRCFMATDMDVLVLGRHVLLKAQQPQQMSEAERNEHLGQFQLD